MPAARRELRSTSASQARRLASSVLKSRKAKRTGFFTLKTSPSVMNTRETCVSRSSTWSGCGAGYASGRRRSVTRSSAGRTADEALAVAPRVMTPPRPRERILGDRTPGHGLLDARPRPARPAISGEEMPRCRVCRGDGGDLPAHGLRRGASRAPQASARSLASSSAMSLRRTWTKARASRASPCGSLNTSRS